MQKQEDSLLIKTGERHNWFSASVLCYLLLLHLSLSCSAGGGVGSTTGLMQRWKIPSVTQMDEFMQDNTCLPAASDSNAWVGQRCRLSVPENENLRGVGSSMCWTFIPGDGDVTSTWYHSLPVLWDAWAWASFLWEWFRIANRYGEEKIS